MYFIQFEVTPRHDHPKTNEIAGAVVNCWIERPTLEEAIEVAQEGIRAISWIVDEPDEAYIITRDDYDDDSPGLPYFEQALIDKEVFVFHCCPVDEDEID